MVTHGIELSKIAENVLEYTKQAEMKKHPARFACVFSPSISLSRNSIGFHSSCDDLARRKDQEIYSIINSYLS